MKKPNKENKMLSWLAQSKNKQRIMLFILFLLFGIVVSNHVRSIQLNNRNSDLTSRYRQVQQDLAKAEQNHQQLLEENESLLSQRDNAIDTMLSQQGQEELLADISRIRVLAGFTEVRGKGVTVTLDDKPGYDPLKDPVASIIHDGNIRHVVNLLINNGAAAISINDVRVVNSSYIYCIGPTILCNKERMTPPYVITALGPMTELASAVKEDQVLNQLQIPEIGIVVQIRENEEVVVPPFKEADNFEQYIDLLEVKKP
jgi:uncharacterized protein YlxW (UPF0749 family)